MKPGDAITFKPLQVTPRKNESPERMLKRFTKKVRNEGVLKEFFERRYFVKPSEKRRKKRMMAKWNAQNCVRK